MEDAGIDVNVHWHIVNTTTETGVQSDKRKL